MITKNNEINVCNYKENKIKKSFRGHNSTITCIEFMHGTNFVVTACEDGCIII